MGICLFVKMLMIHQSQFLRQPSKLVECSAHHQCNHFTNFTTVAYTNRKCSNPRKLKAQNPSSKVMFMDKRHRRNARAQDLDTEFDKVSDDLEGDDELDGPKRRFRESEEKDYDRDPEFAEILGSCLDDHDKAQSKMEERLRKKRNKILHTKTGSGLPMKVTFNKQSDRGTSLGVSELSQSPLDKRPSYDAIQGANVEPSTFYNIGDLEIQDNVARIWVDIGTSEPLLLDVLLNASTQISSDFVSIKEVVFGGSKFENWNFGRRAGLQKILVVVSARFDIH